MGRKKQGKESELHFDSLYSKLNSVFVKQKDDRGCGCTYTLSDILRSGFAMFSLKSPSLLDFQKRSRTEGHNLQTIYGIEALCSDSCMRTALDEVSPGDLQAGFSRLAGVLEHHGILKQYQFRKQQLLVSIDGVEHFHSKDVHCSQCLSKQHKDGTIHYYHQMLVAVLIHPDQGEVFPLACEAIVQQDGAQKNDCERNAANRLLDYLEKAYPDWNLIVVEDGLYGNGPHLRQVKSHEMEYIIGVKPDDHKTLFQQFDSRVARSQAKNYRLTDEQGLEHHFEWANNLPLNSSNADLRVNLLHYTETDLKGKLTTFTWIFPWKITQRNVFQNMRAARARWKIENETFNTLKNQGYHFEHNYGHGSRYLATVLAILMLLAFSIDQIQQHASRTFKLIWQGLKTRKKMWAALKASFTMQKAHSMQQVWQHIAWEYEIELDTS